MPDTPVSLLERLKTRSDRRSWDQLVSLYTPLIAGWLRRYALQPQDVDDIVQEVMSAVVRDLPRFERGRAGSFRAWLRQIMINRLRAYWRGRRGKAVGTGDSDVLEMLQQLEDPHSALWLQWDRQHDQQVVVQLLASIRSGFREMTWRAFWGVAIEGKAAESVARELKISENAVYVSKSRVLRRLRQEAEGLLD